jgi:hypothetical protein
MADYLEANTDVPVPEYIDGRCYYSTRDSFLEAARLLADGGGMIEKKAEPPGLGANYKAIRHFGPVSIVFSVPRNLVCRLVHEAVYECPDTLLTDASEEVPWT